MSDPFESDTPSINGAIGEIISGISALHMEPDPIPHVPEDRIFLAERDAWVKHSLEHFRAAIRILKKVENLECKK